MGSSPDTCRATGPDSKGYAAAWRLVQAQVNNKPFINRLNHKKAGGIMPAVRVDPLIHACRQLTVDGRLAGKGGLCNGNA